MATLFWYGGTGNWSSATGHWSTNSGNIPDADHVAPTASDDVVFDSLSHTTNYTVTVDASSTCKDLTMGAPLTNKVTWAGSSALAISGSLNLSGGTGGITRTYTGAITFNRTSAGGTITCNSVTLASTTVFDGVSGVWTLQDTLNNGTSGITLTNGSFDTNAQTITCGTLASSNTNTRTLTITNSTINCSQWNIGTPTNLTFTSTGSTITLSGSGSGGVFQTGGKNYNVVSISVTSTGSDIVAGSNGSSTFASLTLTGQAVKTCNTSFDANHTISGTLTLTGNSVTNRLLVDSSTVGTPRTLTAATVVVDKVDFMDITGAGAASWDMSGAAEYTGNCGGNSMKALGDAAFTTATTQHWTNVNGGSWSGSNWTSRVPLPQDDVVMDCAFGDSKTVTQDMPRMGKSVDFTGATWTTSLTFTLSTTASLFGSLNLIDNLTLGVGTTNLTFGGRSSYTLNTHSLTFDKPLFLNAPSGTLQLASNLTLNSARRLTVTNGTFTCVNGGNNYALSIGLFTLSPGGTITLGSALHEITGTAWNVTGGTISASTGTLKFTDSSGSAMTFVGNGNAYNNIWWARGASTASNTISGSNTFTDFKDTGTAAHSILFTTGTTQHVTTFTVTGNGAGNEISINSTTTGTHALIKDGGGTISCDYLNIQHSVATPATTWYAGANSINNQAVATAGSGWTFTAPPGAGPVNVKSYNNLSSASVKSWNGLAIASIKTFNGLN